MKNGGTSSETTLPDYSLLREWGKKNAHRAWHIWLVANYKTLGFRATRREIRVRWPALFEELGKRSIDKPKRSTNFTAGDLHSILYYQEKNTCDACGKPVPYYAPACTWQVTCSRSCAAKSTKIKQSRAQTSIERYGVNNVFRLDTVKERIKKTIRVKYGCDNPSQSKQIEKKKRQTNMRHFGTTHWTKAESMKHKIQSFTPNMLKRGKRTTKAKYGVENILQHSETRETIKKTNLARYGVENPFSSKAVQAKIRKTSMQRYGVPNPGMSPIIKQRIQNTCMEKYGTPAPLTSGYKRYTVMDFNGKQHQVQGFERLALNFFSSSSKVKSIETRNRYIPRFRYRTEDNKERNYYPDMLVTRTDGTEHVVEVKSVYTLVAALDINIRKFRVATRGCRRKGQTFWLFCYSNKGDRLVRVKNPETIEDVTGALGI